MREMRPCGFVRGVPGDWYPYRDSQNKSYLFNSALQNTYVSYRRADTADVAVVFVIVWRRNLAVVPSA